MKAPENRVFSIAEENKPVPGCTISELVSTDNGYYILHFSLAPDTSISAESYRQPKLWLVADGEMEAFTGYGVSAGCSDRLQNQLPQGIR